MLNNVWMQTGKLRLILLFLLTIGCFGLARGGDAARAGSDSEVIDRIVAIVNDDIIVLSELNEKLKPYTDRIVKMGYPPEKEKKMMYKVREDIINSMVDQKLTDQEVRKFGIIIDDAEVMNAIERVKQKKALTEEQMLADLARQGMTLEALKKNIRQQMLRARLVNVAVRSKIVITREDARAYFESHPEEFRGEKKIHLWNIMTTTPEFAFESEIQAGREQMTKVVARLDSGEAFAKIARELSAGKGPVVANDIGEFRFGVLSPELQAAVGSLKAGEHTGLLDTDNGFQIFYVHKIDAGTGKQFDDVVADIQQKLFNELVDKRFEEWLDDLREKSHIQIIR
jgi:peptidyl-prolyl cis-trans isomerase SurA